MVALSSLPAEDTSAAPPANATPPPLKSSTLTNEPEISAEGHVIFRLKAPGAYEVAVQGQSIPRTALAKDDSGMWTADVGQVPGGIWEYSFYVDGLQIADPGNPAIKPQRAPKTSILQLPSQPPAPWDFRPEVPHGTMHRHDYVSTALKELRRLHVYTPPGYERAPSIKYPVLYLVHGFGDNDAAWSEHGKANWILDNLIAQNKAKPMIIVMPDGHAYPPETTSRQDYGPMNLSGFENELITDIIPLIESDYHVQPDAANRALAGLSMGGGHALFTGLRRLDKFAWIGAFSAGIPQQATGDTLPSAASINGALKLLWIACGKSDGLFPRNLKLDETLTEKGIHHTWVASEGDHSWPVWRNYLVQFAPLIF